MKSGTFLSFDYLWIIGSNRSNITEPSCQAVHRRVLAGAELDPAGAQYLSASDPQKKGHTEGNNLSCGATAAKRAYEPEALGDHNQRPPEPGSARREAHYDQSRRSTNTWGGS